MRPCMAMISPAGATRKDGVWARGIVMVRNSGVALLAAPRRRGGTPSEPHPTPHVVLCTRTPELRHSFLLSSSTVFMFSIQIASTGPSSTSHLRSGDVSRANERNATASTPSVHSFDTGSSSPYNWPSVTLLGLMVDTLTRCSPHSPAAAICESAAASTRIADDFMPKLRPTSMRPCRMTTISYSWMAFSRKLGSGCRPALSAWSVSAAVISE
eukprot:364399-Chlamydomonas_euryale.AAC.3